MDTALKAFIDQAQPVTEIYKIIAPPFRHTDRSNNALVLSIAVWDKSNPSHKDLPFFMDAGKGFAILQLEQNRSMMDDTPYSVVHVEAEDDPSIDFLAIVLPLFAHYDSIEVIIRDIGTMKEEFLMSNVSNADPKNISGFLPD